MGQSPILNWTIRKGVSRVWLELLIYECGVFQTSAGTRPIVYKFTKSDTSRETLAYWIPDIPFAFGHTIKLYLRLYNKKKNKIESTGVEFA